MSLALDFVSAAPTPEPKVTLDFSLIEWWPFTIILFATFLVLGFKLRWAWISAGIMVGVAVLYLAFIIFLLPILK